MMILNEQINKVKLTLFAKIYFSVDHGWTTFGGLQMSSGPRFGNH